MIYKFEAQIKEHALEVAPQEACGWVIKSATDALESVRSENCASDPLNEFKVELERHLSLVKSGLLVAYYHSHVTDAHLTTFSEADKLVSEETHYPVYLYLVKEDRMMVYTPKGFKAPLEGRPYIPRIFDCFTTTRDCYRENGIDAPDFELGLNEALTGVIPATQMLKDAKFIPVLDTKRLDLLVMHYKSIRPNHLGVYLGDGHFLHQLYNTRSKVEVYGGQWKECVSGIYRHESLI
jgi:proteasome lid subunit RPN8/RPN11